MAYEYIENDVAEHVIRHSITGDPEPSITTIATRWDSGAESLSTLSIFVKNTWNTQINTFLSNLSTFIDVVSTGRDAGGTLVQTVTGAAIVGGTSGLMLPQNCALLVKKNTGLVGRRFRGRMYVPYILREAQVDQAGLIASGEVTGLQTAFTAFYAALAARTPTADTTLLHPEPVSLGVYETNTPITSLTVDSRIATQRRRLRP